MSIYRQARVLARVLEELLLYDLVMRIWGFAGVHRWARRRACGRTRGEPRQVEAAVVGAVTRVGSFYWKPIRCLERSVVTARVLARYGIPAEVVIGYRPSPFFSHAWVEVNGRIANDLQGYRQSLRILERM